MRDAWYRSTDWSDSIRDEFEAKLRRTRVWNRVQYLAIKGGGIASAGHVDAGIELIQRSIAEEDGPAFLRNGAREQLADILRGVGRDAEAMDLYRHILAHPAQGGGTSAVVDLKLVDTLLGRWNPESESEANALLRSRLADTQSLRLPSDQFHLAVSMARVAENSGDTVSRREWARTALQQASAAPVLPHKPYFGIVRADERTLAWLSRCAEQPLTA